MTIKECYGRFNRKTALVTGEGQIESIDEGAGFVNITLSDRGNLTTIYVDSMPLLNGLCRECIKKESERISYWVDMRNVIYMYEVLC